jgi:hypothetical protein
MQFKEIRHNDHPRMQRVEAKTLHEFMHNFLTQKEWFEISDKLCRRQFGERIAIAERELQAANDAECQL